MMRRTTLLRVRPVLALAAAALAFSGAGCRRPGEDVVTFAGSSTIQPVIESLQEFYAQHGIRIRVQGGGTSVGLRSAEEKMALIAMASRELTEKEKAEFDYVTIAKDAVAIIVHKDNPLDGVDDALVRDIYGGKKSTWDDGKPISVINKEAGRATLIVFEEFFGLANAIRKDAVIIGANGQAIASVAADPSAIAYVSVADCLAAVQNGTPIKILKLNGVAPSLPTILSGEYKLARPLNLAYLRSEKERAEPVLRLMRDATPVDKIKERNFVPSVP